MLKIVMGQKIPELIKMDFKKDSIKKKAKDMGIRCNYYFNQYGKYKKKCIN